MNVTIFSKNIKPSERLESTIENKLGKLDKYFSSDSKATVVLTEEKVGLAKLEVTIHAGTLTFRAEEKNSDLYYCLDRVVDMLSSQMSRLKGKLIKRHKDVKEVFISEIPDAKEQEDQGLVRIKDVELTTLSSEEAILQMEMLDHTFFVFQDAETGSPSVVYKRKNGGYGLLRTR